MSQCTCPRDSHSGSAADRPDLMKIGAVLSLFPDPVSGMLLPSCREMHYLYIQVIFHNIDQGQAVRCKADGRRFLRRIDHEGGCLFSVIYE